MMPPEEPKVRNLDRYRVGEICRLLRICRNTLYGYERRGRITLTPDSDGRRYATGAEIIRCYRGLPAAPPSQDISTIYRATQA